MVARALDKPSPDRLVRGTAYGHARRLRRPGTNL